jgi:SprT-like family
MQLALWPGEPLALAEPAAPAAGAVAPAASTVLWDRLTRLGLPTFARFDTHRNHQVMLSWTPGLRFRVHEGYAQAPDEVLKAIVRFVRPGARRGDRIEARRIFLAFPADQYAPAARPEVRPPTARPEDAGVLAELRRLHTEFNRAHFGGRLTDVPIHLSPRMRTRLGELRLDRKTGRPVHIGIGRRHLRRDGWRGVRETLLHEMIHQWQAETGRPVDHGTQFRRMAQALGIPPRAVRIDL